MLEIVKYRDHRAGAQKRCSETGIQQNLYPMFANREGQNQLFPQDSRRTEGRLDRLPRLCEVRAIGNQVGASLAIGKHDVLVHCIDFGKRSQQIAEIDLRAAHASRNQIEGIDADAKHLWLQKIYLPIRAKASRAG
jgi:hypothetical protein